MEDLSPGLGVAIMMNNYFHDVATGLLAASAVAVWFIMRRYRDDADRETKEYFLRIYRSMTRLARFSLFWILLGGIPRTIYFQQFELRWTTGKDLAVTVDHALIPAVIVKHVLMFALVGMGVYFWVRFNRKVKAIRASLGEGQDAPVGDGGVPDAGRVP